MDLGSQQSGPQVLHPRCLTAGTRVKQVASLTVGEACNTIVWLQNRGSLGTFGSQHGTFISVSAASIPRGAGGGGLGRREGEAGRIWKWEWGMESGRCLSVLRARRPEIASWNNSDNKTTAVAATTTMTIILG